MLFIRKAGTDILHSRQPFFTLKLDIQVGFFVVEILNLKKNKILKN